MSFNKNGEHYNSEVGYTQINVSYQPRILNFEESQITPYITSNLCQPREENEAQSSKPISTNRIQSPLNNLLQAPINLMSPNGMQEYVGNFNPDCESPMKNCVRASEHCITENFNNLPPVNGTDNLPPTNAGTDAIRSNLYLQRIELEREFLQREKEILQRERMLFERERNLVLQNNVEQTKRHPQMLHPNDVSHIVPEYDPSNKSGPNSIQWIRRMKQLQQFYGWSDKEVLHYGAIRLRGSAKLWFFDMENPFSSFDQFCAKLSESFAVFSDEADLHQRLSNRIKRPDESFENYFYDVRQMARSGNLSESAIMKYLISGITNLEIKQTLSLTPFNNSDEILKQLQWFEQMPQRQTILRKVDGNNSQSRKFKVEISQNPSQQSSVSQTSQSSRSAIRCYNCNELGHFATKCLKPIKEKCAKCNKRHLAGKCDERITSPIALINDNDEFIIQLQLCMKDNTAQNVSAILDTGSPINIIRKCMLPDKIKLEPSDGKLYADLNGSKLSILGVIKINCKIKSKKFVIRFHVVTDSTMVYDCIIGREFLRDPQVDFDIFNKHENGLFDEVYQKLDCDKEVDQLVIDTVESGREVQSIENSCQEQLDGILENRVELFDQVLSMDYTDFQVELKYDIGPYYQSFKEDRSIEKDMINMIHHYNSKPTKERPDLMHELKINLTSSQPIYCAPNRLSVKDRQTVKQIVDDLLNRGVIQKSNSDYTSRIVLVNKRDGKQRLCVDYRRLNKITVKDRYPLPRIEDCLDRLENKKVFTIIDLKNGFHHIPVHKDSVKYTSFITPDGQFEYLRTPFGLSNAPAAFQRYVSEVFEPLVRTGNVIIYIDDILIATVSVEEHFEVLGQVFELLYNNCLEIQPAKCLFFKPNLDYLGYEVSSVGIKPSQRHIESVRDYPVPKNVFELQRFLGLSSFFRKFIHKFSLVAKPLQDLLRKDVAFEFGADEVCSFEAIKSRLISAPVLAYYSPRRETELHTDASKAGYGAILLQKQDDGFFHPVSFFSKRSTEAESRYHSFELESLAIIYALKRFHIYLHGIPFRIITDCNSLKQTLEKKDTNCRIMRWSLFLENYEYEIIHRGNVNMRHVDALSRIPGVLAIHECGFSQVLANYQLTDRKVRDIKKDLRTDCDSELYTVRDNLLYRKFKEKLLFYVPEPLESSVIRQFHDVGHVGANKVIELIRRTYWFPNMRDKVTKYIKGCLKCLMFQPKDGRKEGLLNIFEKYDKPFHTIHIDHVGPLEETNRKNRHILGITDGFTKYVKLYPTRTTNTREVKNIITKYFLQFSVPQRLVSDRGTCFTSVEFRSFLEKYRVKHVLNATNSPQSNGQEERMHRTLVPMIAKTIDFENNKNWDNYMV